MDVSKRPLQLQVRYKRARYSFRQGLSLHPEIAPLLDALFRTFRGHALPFPTSATELLVDGFQGSANSFFLVEFNRRQTVPVRLVGHGHAAGAVVKATKLGVPTIVLVREPLSAVASLISRWPYISHRQGLQSYISFYSHVMPFHEDYIVATFENVIRDIGAIIQRTNQRFGTKFGWIETEPPSLSPGTDPARQERKEAARQVLSTATSLTRERKLALRIFDEFRNLSLTS